TTPCARRRRGSPPATPCAAPDQGVPLGPAGSVPHGEPCWYPAPPDVCAALWPGPAPPRGRSARVRDRFACGGQGKDLRADIDSYLSAGRGHQLGRCLRTGTTHGPAVRLSGDGDRLVSARHRATPADRNPPHFGEGQAAAVQLGAVAVLL